MIFDEIFLIKNINSGISSIHMQPVKMNRLNDMFTNRTQDAFLTFSLCEMISVSK